MDRTPISKDHYHIKWNSRSQADWEVFTTKTEATRRALELVKPGELFEIQKFDSTCVRCNAINGVRTPQRASIRRSKAG